MTVEFNEMRSLSKAILSTIVLIPLLQYTLLQHPAHCESPPKVEPLPIAERERLALSDFYQKHLSVLGLPILSSSQVSDEALLEAGHIVQAMLKTRPDLAERLRDAKVRISIMGSTEQTVDIPEHSDLKPAQEWNARARGLGATSARPACSAAEENLLHFEKDRYSFENILIHEFAHTIHLMSLRQADATFQPELDQAYGNAKANGLWKDTYAISNSEEYWAEGVQSYFDANGSEDGQHNAIDTREELAQYDPSLFALIDRAFRQNGWRYEGRVRSWLEEANENREGIVSTWVGLQPARRVGLRFLLENMPESDMKVLSGAFLAEQVNGAYDALEGAPWRDKIPDDVFLNAILPYASVSERRDAWMADFRKRFAPIVEGISDPGEAAAKLNQTIYGMLDVKYSTKRKRADQSPYESIETHTASCTGLSILLIDACRSVGIPARFVGTPLWTDQSGNHSWVEVWNEGDWHFTGACEPAGNRLDEGWFIARASEAKIDQPRHAIYAVSFKRTPLLFPMVWDRSGGRSYALNVTARYTAKKVELAPGQLRVRFRVLDPESKQRVSKKIVVRDQEGKVLLDGNSRDEQFDSNDHLEVVVIKDQPLTVEVEGRDGKVELKGTDSDQLFTL